MEIYFSSLTGSYYWYGHGDCTYFIAIYSVVQYHITNRRHIRKQFQLSRRCPAHASVSDRPAALDTFYRLLKIEAFGKN
jgi:hypothetical protein